MRQVRGDTPGKGKNPGLLEDTHGMIIDSLTEVNRYWRDKTSRNYLKLEGIMFINSYVVYTVNPISGSPIMFHVDAINSTEAYVSAMAIMRDQYNCYFGRIELTIVEL